jgi:hypothetical protein
LNLFFKSNSGWNEFQWEQEIRRDEQRISCYFQELAGCLDLPGEDEMIFNRLMSRPGLVPANADPAHWRMWDELDDEDDEDDDFGARHRFPGDELVDQLDMLSSEWNVLFAFELRETLKADGLAVSCLFGKILSRISDFLETDEREKRGLKISLGKRALADIGELYRALEGIGRHQKSLRPKLASISEFLLQIRERVIDIAEHLRRRA